MMQIVFFVLILQVESSIEIADRSSERGVLQQSLYRPYVDQFSHDQIVCLRREKSETER